MLVETLIDALSDAIAYAEGFFVSGSRSWRNNNPGDLTLDITGTGITSDGPFVVYATAADGWDALKTQVREMIDGTSGIYNPSMTIQDIANRYTTTQQQAWAANVASRLGVSTSTTLQSLLTTVGTVSVGTVTIAAIVVFFLFFKRKG